MTCLVYADGILEPIEVDEDFAGCVNALNISSAKGNAFVVMDGMGDGHEAFYIPNIIRIKEITD